MFEKMKENWGLIFVVIFAIITVIVNVIMHITDDHDTSITVESLVTAMNILLPMVVIGFVVWKVVTNHPLVSSATSTIETANDAIEKVKTVKELPKKAKEVILKVKGFKMPKLGIKDKISKLKFWKRGVKDV